MQETEYIWHHGKLIPWKDATVHVLAHGLHYGSSLFEGIRVYDTSSGPAFLCLEKHLKRLFDSARLYRMDMPFSYAAIEAACHQVIAANKLRAAYVRPIAYRGYGSLKVYGNDVPVEIAIAAFPWDAYLGEEAMQQGVSVGISSWTRVAPNTLPAMAKAGGNYLSSQLISMEARRHGYDEGLALTPDGYLSEGAGQNVFIVKDATLYTPPLTPSILPGITREIVIALAQKLGYATREENLPREMLYAADEAFMTGTASEIVPVRSVDAIDIGNGRRGPITQALQKSFFGIFDGSTPTPQGWLQYLRP